MLRVYLDDSARARWRREKSWPDLIDVEVAGPPPERELALTVLAALKTLPPRQRAAVVLRYWEDRDIEETAALLGVSAGTVKSQCAKAMAALRVALADITSVEVGR